VCTLRTDRSDLLPLKGRRRTSSGEIPGGTHPPGLRSCGEVSSDRRTIIADQDPSGAVAGQPPTRQARGRDRQRALVDAARDLFLRHGYRGTTLEAIIARAGGSRETIYRLFGGKHGLFGAIIAEVGEQFAASIVAPGAFDLAPREALTRLGLQLVAIWDTEEGRAINRVVVSEGLAAPDIVDAWYRGATLLSVDALARYLAAQVQAGRLTALDPQLVARQFMMLLIGERAFPLIARDQAPAEPDVQVGRCVELILSAFENTGLGHRTVPKNAA
jgi:TetR/AcrR family transcriptional repressor of mexJK operon